jgi:hypothetical protein
MRKKIIRPNRKRQTQAMMEQEISTLQHAPDERERLTAACPCPPLPLYPGRYRGNKHVKVALQRPKSQESFVHQTKTYTKDKSVAVVAHGDAGETAQHPELLVLRQEARPAVSARRRWDKQTILERFQAVQ